MLRQLMGRQSIPHKIHVLTHLSKLGFQQRATAAAFGVKQICVQVGGALGHRDQGWTGSLACSVLGCQSGMQLPASDGSCMHYLPNAGRSAAAAPPLHLSACSSNSGPLQHMHQHCLNTANHPLLSPKDVHKGPTCCSSPPSSNSGPKSAYRSSPSSAAFIPVPLAR